MDIPTDTNILMRHQHLIQLHAVSNLCHKLSPITFMCFQLIGTGTAHGQHHHVDGTVHGKGIHLVVGQTDRQGRYAMDIGTPYAVFSISLHSLHIRGKSAKGSLLFVVFFQCFRKCLLIVICVFIGRDRLDQRDVFLLHTLQC